MRKTMVDENREIYLKLELVVFCETGVVKCSYSLDDSRNILVSNVFDNFQELIVSFWTWEGEW